jgi:hypothetical protein
MKTEKDEPINPFFTWNEAGYGETVTFYSPDGSKQFFPYKQGLTKREYFAGLAMQGFISTEKLLNGNRNVTQVQYAEAAVIMADALINALNKDIDDKEEAV